jgi:predicted dehydrogenase
MNKKKNKYQKILIIGSGSIAYKHAKILSDLNFEIVIFSKRKKSSFFFKGFKNIKFLDNLKNISNNDYKFCIIANETYKHFDYIKKLLKLNFNIYCEKPIAIKKNHLKILKKYTLNKKFNFTCGYQLLGSDIISSLKKVIRKKVVKSVNVYVGHNIKYWRKHNRYQSYYLNKNLGGGAINELIHEINLINSLFGKIVSIKTFKTKSKKYNCEDVAISVFKTNKNIIGSLNQEIVNENFRRHINILTETEEIIVDIFKGTISTYRKNKLINFYNYGKINQKEMLKNNLKSFIKSLNNKKKDNQYKDFLNSIYDAEIALKMHND